MKLFICIFFIAILSVSNSFSQNRNAGYLKGSYKKNGYDWWWHSFVAKDKITGELQPFFIEYYFINPSLSADSVILGQLQKNKTKKLKPCYAMLKCGTWRNDSSIQLNAFYPIKQSKYSTKELLVEIGDAKLSETYLNGKVAVSEKDALQKPELMSNAGTMEWNLNVNKKLSYCAGYGTGKFFRALKAFRMYWHIQGMLAEYSGTIKLNGREYIVEPNNSFGYQDKNWGVDYTNPWVWLNCNNFKDKDNKQKELTSLDVGGGRPVVFGIPLNKKILVAFYHEGKLYEYNFSKFWKRSKTNLNCYSDSNFVYWKITAFNKKSKVEIDFKCPKNKMLKVNYENPKGEKNHTNLWNGGHAEGTLKLYKKEKSKYTLIEEMNGSYGGCEYGEY